MGKIEMPIPHKEAQSRKSVKDRLIEARRNRFKEIDVAGTKFKVKKWGIRQGIEYIDIVAGIIKKCTGGGSISDLLTSDFSKLKLDFSEDVINILAGSIHYGNFDDEQEAAEFVDEELTFEEGVDLFIQIVKQNMSPLMERLKSETEKKKKKNEKTSATE